MPRLPTPGSDQNTWGNVLNDFLSVELSSDGTLKKAADISSAVQMATTANSKADDAQMTASAAAVNTSVVHNIGNETIAGIKTFSSSPIVPNPSTGAQVANKDYVDSTVSVGVDGKTVRSGAIDPLHGVGVDGDFYINTTTSYLFGPKASGAWPAGVSLVGPPGASGSSGGEDEAVILSMIFGVL